jgi:hypothetical protein
MTTTKQGLSVGEWRHIQSEPQINNSKQYDSAGIRNVCEGEWLQQQMLHVRFSERSCEHEGTGLFRNVGGLYTTVLPVNMAVAPLLKKCSAFYRTG